MTAEEIFKKNNISCFLMNKILPAEMEELKEKAFRKDFKNVEELPTMLGNYTRLSSLILENLQNRIL